jgi:aminoglycoside 6-adenylyltransferase
MQLADGVRLDLHVVTRNYAAESLQNGEPYYVLLDKCGCLPDTDYTSDKAYRIKRPDENVFLASCNEFWWCLNNLAKELWRDEPLYVMDMLNGVVRPELIRLLGWRVGTETNFSVSVGKSGKYLDKWLPKRSWERLMATFPPAENDAIWESVFVMCDLFDETAVYLAEKLEFRYDIVEANNSRNFCAHVRKLPKDAMGVY